MSLKDQLLGGVHHEPEVIPFNEVGFAILRERLRSTQQRANWAMAAIGFGATIITGLAGWTVTESRAVTNEAIERVDGKLDDIIESRKESSVGFTGLHKKAEERDKAIEKKLDEEIGEVKDEVKEVQDTVREGNRTNSLILEHLLELKRR